jgi:hypothetical protein
MSNSFTTERSAVADVWAEIRTSEQVIRYRRMGAGHPVLVLGEEREICPAVARALTEAGSIRLIMPEMPTDEIHVAGWAADFLEGLGATSVGLLATGTFCIGAIELAMLGSELIERLVLVADEPGRFGRWCEEWQAGALGSGGRAGNVPLLLVHKGQPLDEIGPVVRGFFAGK